MDLSSGQIIALITIAFATILTLAACAFEVWQYKLRRQQLPFWQRFLRGLGVAALLLLLIRLGKGTLFVLPGMQEPRHILSYWADCLAIGIILCAFLLLDLKAVLAIRRQTHDQIDAMRQDMIDTFKAHAIDEQAEDGEA